MNQPARKSWIILLQARERHLQKKFAQFPGLHTRQRRRDSFFAFCSEGVLLCGKRFRELLGLAKLHCHISVRSHKSFADQSNFVVARL